MKVAILLANGFETVEALAVKDVLTRCQIETHLISIDNNLQVTSAQGVMVVANASLQTVDFSTIDLLYLPGGMPGTSNLKASEAVLKLVTQFHAQNKPLAAICAAPTILQKAGVLATKSATVYPTFASELGSSYRNQAIVIDETILTAANASLALEFGFTIARYLKCDVTDVYASMREGCL